MVIFNSYVKLPEGSSYLVYVRMTYNDNVLIIKKNQISDHIFD